MKNVLITGGAGFIGSHLSEHFVNNGYFVIIIDNLFRGKLENISSLISTDKCMFINLDMADMVCQEYLADLLAKYKPIYILHYAAINGTQYFYEMPEMVANVNCLSTSNLMSALACSVKADPLYKPKVIFASSSEAYGEPLEIPTSESGLTYVRIDECRDSYAVSKLMGEFLVKLYAERLKLDFLIFRIFNVYGPRMVASRFGQVIPEFIDRIHSGEYPLRIYGDGSHTRSFIYVQDHVNLLYRAILDAELNNVYNIGNPDEISIITLAAKILHLFGKKPSFEFLEERSGDHLRRVPDISKLISSIGTFSFTPLDVGLEELVKSYNS